MSNKSDCVETSCSVSARLQLSAASGGRNITHDLMNILHAFRDVLDSQLCGEKEMQDLNVFPSVKAG